MKPEKATEDETQSASPELHDDDPDDPQDRDQVGGYEGCKRDYDTLVMPFMSNIAYSLLEVAPICELLLEYTNATGDQLDLIPMCDCVNTTETVTMGTLQEDVVAVWECTTDLQLPVSETFCEDVYDNVTAIHPILGSIISDVLNLLPMCECEEIVDVPLEWECVTHPLEPVNHTTWGIRSEYHRYNYRRLTPPPPGGSTLRGDSSSCGSS